LRLRFAKPTESRGSRSRFSWRNAPKEPAQNIAGKKRVRPKDVDFDYLFGNTSIVLVLVVVLALGERMPEQSLDRLRSASSLKSGGSKR
jgi:hypothetical protein